MKNQNTFKVGDLVYVPSETTEVCWIEFVGTDKLILNIKTSCKVYIDGTNAVDMPVILPATQENYELLSKLYPNVSFEPPPKRKEPKEIIKAMLDSGYHGVPCKTECGRDKYICTGIVEGEFYPFQYDNDEDNAYGSGIPYHPKTGLKIVDFIDGKCVLENGEVVE